MTFSVFAVLTVMYGYNIAQPPVSGVDLVYLFAMQQLDARAEAVAR